MSVARTLAIGLGLALLLVGSGGLIAGRLAISCVDETPYIATFTGTVRNATTNTPIGGSTVELYAVLAEFNGGMLLRTVTTNAQGKYAVEQTVRGGEDYTIVARASFYDAASVLTTTPCPIGAAGSRTPQTITIDLMLLPFSILDAGFVATISGRDVTFVDASTGGPDRWTWTFGDGTPAVTVATPAVGYTYAADGTYTVSMMASRTSPSASDTATATISVAALSAGAPPGTPPPTSQVETTTGNPDVITNPPPATSVGNETTGDEDGAGGPIVAEREQLFLLAILVGAIVLAIAVPGRRR